MLPAAEPPRCPVSRSSHDRHEPGGRYSRAVSRENIEMLLRIMDAFNSGDIERILELMHPDFETAVPAELSAEPDVYRGAEGVRRYFDSWDPMEDIRFEAREFWEAGEVGGDESLVADVHLTAKGRHTAIAVEQHIAQVWTLRDGRALRVATYPTLEQALAAAGLPPPAGEGAAA
jgi:ketosteroid isomerase-like protein